jgi:hypothetical protein
MSTTLRLNQEIGYLRQLQEQVRGRRPLHDIYSDVAAILPIGGDSAAFADCGGADLLGVDGPDAVGMMLHNHGSTQPAVQTDLTILK